MDEIESRERLSSPSPQFGRFNWTIIWRSPRRPQHFAALVKELGRLAKDEYAGESTPAWVCFHIYRTHRKASANQAAARVDWTDENRPGGATLIALWDGNCPRLGDGYEPDEALDYLESKTASREGFLNFAAQIGDRLDKITVALIAHGVGPDGWTDGWFTAYTEADDAWETGPFAPPELKVVELYLRNYLLALHAHRRFFVELRGDTDPRMPKWREETVAELAGYGFSVRRLLKAVNWEG